MVYLIANKTKKRKKKTKEKRKKQKKEKNRKKRKKKKNIFYDKFTINGSCICFANNFKKYITVVACSFKYSSFE